MRDFLYRDFPTFSEMVDAILSEELDALWYLTKGKHLSDLAHLYQHRSQE